MRALLLACLALALAVPAAAQDAPAWRAVDASTGRISDLAGMEQLAADFPNSGSVRLRLLTAQLVEGDKEAALESLRWLNLHHYSLSAAAREQMYRLFGDDYRQRAQALVEAVPLIVAASTVIAEVPPDAGLVESVISPVPGEVLIVSSISEKTLFIQAGGEAWERADINGVGDLSGMVADQDRNIGWIAAGNVDGSSDDKALFSGLIRKGSGVESSTLIPAPEGVTLSDLSLDPDGTVFASDPMGGGVYRVAPGATTLERVIAPGTFRSPQGSAVSADGERLYISDYRYGLAFVDLASGKVSRLGSDVPVILDGVDGLWLHSGELIAVQNGTSPMRISAFKLSEEGTRIVSSRVLERAHPEWTEPLGGSIAGDALIYVGTGQWDRYDSGKLRPGVEAIPTQIRRLPLEH